MHELTATWRTPCARRTRCGLVYGGFARSRAEARSSKQKEGKGHHDRTAARATTRPASLAATGLPPHVTRGSPMPIALGSLASRAGSHVGRQGPRPRGDRTMTCRCLDLKLAVQTVAVIAEQGALAFPHPGGGGTGSEGASSRISSTLNWLPSSRRHPPLMSLGEERLKELPLPRMSLRPISSSARHLITAAAIIATRS